MSMKLREGMEDEVKRKLVSHIFGMQKPSLRQQAYQYLKYSQFYKICVNKFGSKSEKIQQKFEKQQQYYISQLCPRLSQMKYSLNKFIFGTALSPPTQEGLKQQIPQNASNIGDFKVKLDEFILECIKVNLKWLQKRYTRQFLNSLTQKSQELQKGVCSSASYSQNFRKWQIAISQALNVNCFYQVLKQLQTTYENIRQFKTNLAKKTVALHSAGIMRNLYEYSLTHKETEYAYSQEK